jgi:hypothetical protein
MILGTSKGDWEANQVRLLYHMPMVTHVIWMLQTGRWPTEGKWIDHINGDVLDCRWLNLREVTPLESKRNTSTPPRLPGTEDGLDRGVSRQGNRYRVVLGDNYQRLHFGSYATAVEANAIALRERLRLHGEFAFELSRGLLTAQQVLDLYQEILMPDLEPAPVYDAHRFVFTRPATVGPDYFEHAAVPQDTDNVDDLTEADHYTVQDNTVAAEMLADGGGSLPFDTHWAIIRTVYRWLRFWAVRHWDEDGRKAAAAMVRQAEAIMDRLAVQAEAVIASRRAEEGYHVDVPWTEPGFLGTGSTPEGIALRKQRIANQRRQTIKSVKGSA